VAAVMGEDFEPAAQLQCSRKSPSLQRLNPMKIKLLLHGSGLNRHDIGNVADLSFTRRFLNCYFFYVYALLRNRLESADQDIAPPEVPRIIQAPSVILFEGKHLTAV